MTRAAPLLFALFASILVGGALGWWGRRTRERVNLPPQRVRPAPLAAALRAWETGSKDDVARALAGAALEATEDRAEAALLRALAAGDLPSVARVAREYAGTHAAARALWEVASRAPTARERAAARTAFAAAWPDAWVLGAASGSPP